MENCKKCNQEFEIPKNAIDMAFATYCKSCIKKGLKKYLKLSVGETIALHAKQIGL